jgi:probable F420-dependent oxidoreductase
MPDHFSEQWGPWVALTVAAMAAPTLRIGTLVLDNDFRHPVEVAKEAATLDVVSGGRLELGVGAGWAVSDYQRSGIPYESPATRIARFEEALTILRGSFSDDSFSFTGRHYQVTALNGQPKPVQKPYPRLMIGAGRKQMLTIAAKHADIVNVTFTMHSGVWDHAASRTGTADATARKVTWIKDAAGSRLDSLELSVPVFEVEVTDSRRLAADRLGREYGLTAEDVLGSPHFLVGSVNGIIEELEQRREDFGFSYIIFGRGTHVAMAPVVAQLAGT